MKHLLFFLLLIPVFVFSQNFENVDNTVLTYPKFSKVEDLAYQIEQDFSSDIDKTRAAFFWLSKNIRYNLKELYNPKQRSYRFSYGSEAEKINKLQAIKDKLVAATFKNKIGVCEEYAQSFKKICDLLNIKAEVIKGHVRNDASEIGKIANISNHAWNAVKVNGKWLILDATWAAGSEYNGKWIRKFNNYFFDMPKEKIFKTHFPEDAIWVLRFGRMTLEEFYNQPIYGKVLLNSKAALIFPDTGIIRVKPEKNIDLKFQNFENSALVYYTFTGMKYAQKPLISKENGITTLTIKNPQKNSKLRLFMDTKIALQFRTR